MNPNELATLVGLAWSRLIFYPGGLALCALLWSVVRAPNQQRKAVSQFATPRSQFLAICSLALAWLGLALLPLPASAPMSRTTDVVIVLALLEWPRVVAIAAELGAANEVIQRAGARRLAAALNSYPILMLATLALAQPSGSLDLAAILRTPSDTAPLALRALHWLGATAWLLALAPSIGLGPFRATLAARQGAQTHRSVIKALALQNLGAWRPRGLFDAALLVRGCALAALAALPWLAPFGALEEQGSYSIAALIAITLAPIVIGGLLWLYDRATVLQSARGWARAYLALDAALLIALLAAAYAALEAR